MTPVTTTPVTRAPVPVTPQSTDPDLIEQIRELVGGRQSAWSAVLPPESRFQIALVGGEAVLDKETNLVWEKSPSTVLEDWRRANNQCNGMTLGGRKGWRLPTVQELASLLEAGETGHHAPGRTPLRQRATAGVLVGHSHHGGFAIRLGGELSGRRRGLSSSEHDQAVLVCPRTGRRGRSVIQQGMSNRLRPCSQGAARSRRRRERGPAWQFLLFHVERLHQPMQVVRVQAEAPGRLRVAAAGLIECVRH